MFLSSFALGSSTVGVDAPNTAFYYGSSLPVAALSNFDQAVVQPANVTANDLKQLKQYGTKVVAYLSIGEIAESDHDFFKIKKDWVAGKNPNWKSVVFDLRNVELLQFLMARIQALKKSGYDGVFLDTLDSYQLVAKTPAERTAYESGLSQLIINLKHNWPESTILVNRGFEIIPLIAKSIDGVVAESLYSGFGGDQQGYKNVPEEGRVWLKNKLSRIQADYSLPVTVLDYLPDARWSESEELAKKILSDGFMPWISDGHLSAMGRGRIKPQPRKILALFDDKKGEIFYNDVHRKLAEPLEYKGFQLEYLDVNRESLPEYPLRGRYAGIVAWFTGAPLKVTQQLLCDWFKAQKTVGIKIALFGDLPQSAQCTEPFHLKQVEGIAGKKLKVVNKHLSVGTFEAKLRVKRLQTPDIASTSINAIRWLQLKSKTALSIDPVIIDDWGGWALNPYVSVEGAEGKSQWIFDPFIFLQDSLRLPVVPAVDVSTESGRRIMTAHIDGDGFVSRAEMAGTPYSGKVILEEILKKYRVPTTVSIIEAEIGEAGLYADQSPALEKIAREIFKQPNVEVATHTFSHPFFWQIFDGDYDVGEEVLYGYNMPVPNYKPDLAREIIGSTAYINSRLAPKDKPVKMILWSGNTLPGINALTMANNQGLLNVNGGDTWPLPYRDSISMIWPVGRPTKGGLQVYAPVLNENVYTNEWHGPYYGYRDAIKSFKILASPKRLKPIGIYYHFYSGSKLAGLDALRQVYDWALKQNPIPLYLSQYAIRANAFYKAALAKTVDGGWVFNRAKDIHTLRAPKALGWPDLEKSKGIAGYREGVDGVYLHLSEPRPIIYFQDKADKRLHLIEANAVVDKWKPEWKGHVLNSVSMSLRGNMPLKFSVMSKSQCILKGNDSPKIYKSTAKKDIQFFTLDVSRLESALLVCQ